MAEDKVESDEGSELYTAKGERRQFVKHSYTDYAQEDDGPLSKKDEAILQQYDENRVAGPFPLKLHVILKILEEEGKDGEFLVFGLLLVLVPASLRGCFLQLFLALLLVTIANNKSRFQMGSCCVETCH